MADSQREQSGYSEVLDFYMSEKFGLDWKEYDHERMQNFIYIMGLKGKRVEWEQDKARARGPGK